MERGTEYGLEQVYNVVQLYDGTRTHLVEWNDGMDSYWFAVKDDDKEENET